MGRGGGEGGGQNPSLYIVWVCQLAFIGRKKKGCFYDQLAKVNGLFSPHVKFCRTTLFRISFRSWHLAALSVRGEFRLSMQIETEEEFFFFLFPPPCSSSISLKFSSSSSFLDLDPLTQVSFQGGGGEEEKRKESLCRLI